MLSPTALVEFDERAPTETETATFGLGCFWGPDARFGVIDGVVRTRVGYAGGTAPDPSYRALGDHTEVVQLEFGPGLRFEELLDVAFAEHDPRRQPANRQYHNVVFVASDDQDERLSSYLADRGFDRSAVETRLEPLERVHLAEPYHQAFHLRGRRWITDAFGAAGYDDADVRESPAAATLNAHVAGHDVEVPFLDPFPSRSR